jgi:hypothetical protein
MSSSPRGNTDSGSEEVGDVASDDSEGVSDDPEAICPEETISRGDASDPQ